MTKTFDLETATAVETARAVRDGTTSALEACEAAITRIEAHDVRINAVVVRDFERAITAAKRIDTTRTKDDPRPLLGVPMTVKESNDVAGLPSTWGMPVFKDLKVHDDGVAVARLKAAGAVILGKTNAPVALADWQTVNPVYGRTVNPHGPERSPGGSSGGAAAALAAGMIPLELGSDIGGSIRIPAHMCGVFGHKPTYGIVPLKGHGFPGTDGVDVPLAVLGPMARSAEDLRIALGVVAGPLPGAGYKLDLPPARYTKLREFRVLVLDRHPSAATASSVRDALAAFADKLEQVGVAVTFGSTAVPDLAAAHGDYTKMLMAVTTRGTPGVQPITAHAWMDLEDEQMRVARRWQALFDDFDIVLTPPFGTPAFPHDDNPNWGERKLMIDGEPTRYGAQVAWAGVATYPGLPATALPIDKTPQGLPIGVQAIGPKYADRTTIAFAELIERERLTA